MARPRLLPLSLLESEQVGVVGQLFPLGKKDVVLLALYLTNQSLPLLGRHRLSTGHPLKPRLRRQLRLLELGL